ncbi:MAG: Isoleucyl-tRNA synthetase [Microgenomates bacterium 39_6]|nr:MAG: Isoleucyl-tRNA synthetase [Microgenomates bacterium 39_6]
MSRKNKPPLKPVSPKANFIENEHKWLKYWQENDIVSRYLQKNDLAKKRFSFFDGPITANNPMGVHHAWGRTYKDLFQRYKNMQGFKQRFQNGFDCQGLWIEVEVEKEKGFTSKKDIEKYGLANFVNDCRARVKKYSAIQTEQSKRLGYFMNWDNSYYTMSEENNYTIWYFLKNCFENGLIYQGQDAVPWCPRCGTAISQHEIDSEGYQQITHQSVFMRFPIVRDSRVAENEFLLVWTTTPWTIPANTLVAIHPEITYALVEFEGNKYWLAKSLVKKVLGERTKIIKKTTGEKLIKEEKITHYQGPFDSLPIIKETAKSKHFHQVVLDKNLVNEEEGTGLVHIVPGAGTEDHNLVKKDLGWEEIIFPVVGETGKYLSGYGNLTGKSAKENPELVINALKNNENGRYFFKTQNYTHSYPTCWRCKEELIWRLVKEWYIAMDKPRSSDGKTLRKQMIRVAKTINWIPEFGLAREIDWLNNMHDWLISKKRYWGLALPIWQCSCGHFEIIGSKGELKKRASSGWQDFAGHTPHRPWIDKVKITCPECGQEMSRIPDVGNPWLDAGIIPFSTLIDPKTKKISYLDDKKYWHKWYPADFITECFPGQFRNWFYSMIAMATQLENSQPFKTILGHALVRDEKGEEMHKSKGNAIWFDEAVEKMGADVIRWLYMTHNPEINVNFGYKNADQVRRQFHILLWNIYRFFVTYANMSPNIDFTEAGSSSHPLDAWIISRLNKLIAKTTNDLDNYNATAAALRIQDFVEELSTWYIRRSRNRMNPRNPQKKDQENALKTVYLVLVTLVKIIAPFTPFLAEEIYHNLTGRESVHLTDWPKAKKEKINQKLEANMNLVRDIASLAHATRKDAQIKLRQPLAKITVSSSEEKLPQELINLLKEEINVKDVVWQKGDKLDVLLDTKITPQLEAEGQAREIIRKIQQLRKKAQLEPNQKVSVTLPDWPKQFEKEIKQKTQVNKIIKGSKPSIVK